MSERMDMDSVRGRAHANVNIPPSVASLIIALANEIDRQQEEISELRQMMLGHERRIADANKNISKLSGVHGA